MNPTGYIKIPRWLFEHDMWLDKRELSKAEAFLDLCQSAAWKPCSVLVNDRCFDLKPGQLIASCRYLQTRWNWKSPNRVHCFLKYLEKLGQLRYTEVQKTGQITICHLESCENPKDTKRTLKRKNGDTGGTLKGHRRNKIEERRKEEVKKEEKERVTASAATLPASPEFDLLKKIGKPAAKLWLEGELEKQFDSPAHKDLALAWLTYRCDIKKPIQSHAEAVALVQNFRQNTLEDLQTLVKYSTDGGYPALYFDRLKKTTTQPGKIINGSKFDKYRNGNGNGSH